MGEFAHPEISIHTHSLARYMDYIVRRDWNGVASLMVSSANKLARVGADFAICPDNTVHNAFEIVATQSPISLLSITETVVHACRLRGYEKIGVLGTKYTMQGPIYQTPLSKYNIETVVPDGHDQEIVNAIIFNELVTGKILKSSLQELLSVIQALKGLGCEAVILGCTELPLVINSENSSLPVIDSTRLLAHKAVTYSLRSQS